MNRDNLHYLISFLAKVVQIYAWHAHPVVTKDNEIRLNIRTSENIIEQLTTKSSVNRMTAKNLAIVWAPTLLRPPMTQSAEIIKVRLEKKATVYSHLKYFISTCSS